MGAHSTPVIVLFMGLGFLVLGSPARGAGGTAELEPALVLLQQTATGRTLIQEAREALIPIQPGALSKTDVTAVRWSDDGVEKVRTQASVHLSLKKPVLFQALDLAHELTHAVEGHSDLFDPDLTPVRYVRNGIEGPGGEARAIQNECEVGREILALGATSLKVSEAYFPLIHARCRTVWAQKKDPEAWHQSFYRLGHAYWDFMGILSRLQMSEVEREAWKNRVKGRPSVFLSATNHKPYPLALLEEYIQVTRSLCERRKAKGREPAAEALGRTSMIDRCRTIGVEW